MSYLDFALAISPIGGMVALYVTLRFRRRRTGYSSPKRRKAS